MEARYRNKNVQGKMNLEVKASEGELWPFLVNLENLKSIAYDKNNDRYIDTSKNETYYKWPDFEKIVEGAYQWMLYYDADTIRTTSHRTITKVTSTNEDSDNEVEVDWEGEFCELTWQYLPALSGKELENFYSNCQLVKSIFKKSKENTEGIFGAEELYDITSDKNFSEAIRDMKEAIRIKGTEINIFKVMINFAKNDEFLTIIITVPFIFVNINELDLLSEDNILKVFYLDSNDNLKYDFTICKFIEEDGKQKLYYEPYTIMYDVRCASTVFSMNKELEYIDNRPTEVLVKKN